MSSRLPRRALSAGVGALAARTGYQVLTRSSAAPRWQRTNHRGEPVTLLEGPAVVVGALAALAVSRAVPGRVRTAAMLSTGVAGLLGGYDDVAGSSSDKGLHGHLGAMSRGELTTGGVKVLGIGAAGLAAGSLARGGRGGAVDALLAGAVVAGSANLVNLLDLRPGRALKVVLTAGLPWAAGRGAEGDLVAGPLGAAAALMPEDLAERAMLGDAGANALGAALGTAAAASFSRSALTVTASAIVALTLASERVSFSEVIDRTPLLRAVDRLGRRPVC